MEKTIKEWLEDLPSPIREEALVNLSDICKDDTRDSVHSALSGAFNWGDSEQKHIYWSNVSLWCYVTGCDITKLKNYIKKK